MNSSDDEREGGHDAPPSMVQRSLFGVGARDKNDVTEGKRPPLTSNELLAKGPAELAIQPGPRVNWWVLCISAAIVLAFSVWVMVMPVTAKAIMHTVVNWIATNLGWYYVVTITLVVVFVLWVALSKEGSVRLGPDHSRPKYNLFT